MKIAFLGNTPSPHQLPLVRELGRRLGEAKAGYVYREALSSERRQMGWGAANSAFAMPLKDHADEVEQVPLLYSGERAFALFRRRAARGLTTLYMSERWFKPGLGMMRLLWPGYFRMAWAFLRCLRNNRFYYFPIGVHAARDFLRMYGLFHGDLRCLFRAPAIAFESRPGGAIVPLREALRAGILPEASIAFAKRFGFAQIPEAHGGKITPCGVWAKLRMWGYFVEPGRGAGGHALPIQHPPRVLWVGRMLDLKRVGDLVRACRPHPDLKRVGVSLDLYGHGPEEVGLRALAVGAENIRFHDFVPVAQVREVMRSHDVYVLPSNAYEGWGAVVSEALEEGMAVLATVESGAGATVLPPENLFSAGDVQALAEKLSRPISACGIGHWNVSAAADALVQFLGSSAAPCEPAPCV